MTLRLRLARLIKSVRFLKINKLSKIKLLWIGARQEICYEDFIEIDVSDNLPKMQLLFIVVTSEKSIHKNKIFYSG